MTRDTIRTSLGLVQIELRRLKLALRDSTDLRERKRMVARVEALRVAQAELTSAAMDARREYLDAMEETS